MKSDHLHQSTVAAVVWSACSVVIPLQEIVHIILLLVLNNEKTSSYQTYVQTSGKKNFGRAEKWLQKYFASGRLLLVTLIRFSGILLVFPLIIAIHIVIQVLQKAENFRVKTSQRNRTYNILNRKKNWKKKKILIFLKKKFFFEIFLKFEKECLIIVKMKENIWMSGETWEKNQKGETWRI